MKIYICLCGIIFLVSACSISQQHEQAVCVGKVSQCGAKPNGVKPASFEKDYLKILAIKPSANAVIDREDILEAKLSYGVTKFSPGIYKVIAQFDTVRARVTDNSGLSNAELLQESSGVVSLKFPIARIWNDPKYRWPLRVRFYILTTDGPDRGTVLVKTKTYVEYQAKDGRSVQPTPEQVRRDEYELALVDISGFLTNIKATNSVCNDKESGNQRMAALYGNWFARNSQLIGQIEERFHSLVLQDFSTSQAAGERVYASLIGGPEKRIRSKSETELQATCVGLIAALEGDASSPENKFGKKLPMVLTYQ